MFSDGENDAARLGGRGTLGVVHRSKFSTERCAQSSNYSNLDLGFLVHFSTTYYMMYTVSKEQISHRVKAS